MSCNDRGRSAQHSRREGGKARVVDSLSPFLLRHLPFWLAVLFQQFFVLLIPIAGLLYPLLRIAPKIFWWVERRRVFKVYSELRLLEDELSSAGSIKADKKYIEQLDRIEDRISHYWLPPSLRPLLYDLRLHISMVREEAQKSASS